MEEKSTNALQGKLDEVKRQCLLPFDSAPFAIEIKRAINGAPEPISIPAKVFLENIEAAVKTTTIPFTLAYTGVLTARLHQLGIRQRLLVERDALTSVEDFFREKTPEEEVERDGVAYERALKEFNEEQKVPAIKKQMIKESITFLLNNLEDKQMQTAAKELLRQAVVMIWGAFEVLCRDAFVGHLNCNPTEVQKLTADTDTKKIFQTKAVGFEELSEYGFDVSKNLGNVFANNYDLSSLGAIKQIFKVLFPSNRDLHEHLRNPKLWLLHQRRHLIVHRRGVVDKQYLENTGEKLKVGEQLTPNPAEIEEYVRHVCDAALALVKAAIKR